MCFRKKKKAASASAKKPSSTPQRTPTTTSVSLVPKDEPLKTCAVSTEKDNSMKISTYKAPTIGGSMEPINSVRCGAANAQADLGPEGEEFENAHVQSMHPINVTQIFEAGAQSNMSKIPTDVVNQDTLEWVDDKIEEMVFGSIDGAEENYPEIEQKRPRPVRKTVSEADNTQEYSQAEGKGGGKGQTVIRSTKPLMSPSKTGGIGSRLGSEEGEVRLARSEQERRRDILKGKMPTKRISKQISTTGCETAVTPVPPHEPRRSLLNFFPRRKRSVATTAKSIVRRK